MSFKLFFLNALGGIKSTDKLEVEHRKLWEDYQEFLQVNDSEELNSFLELEKFVKSDSFSKTKSGIQGLIFKGSAEDKQLKEFVKLEKDKKLKKYYLTVGSADLTRYEKLKDGDLIKEYNDLKAFIESGKLKAEKEKLKKDVFKGSKEEQKLKEFGKLKKDKSPERYEELKKEVESVDFKSRVTYLKDNKKFEKTEAFANLQRYNQLKKSDDIRFFLKYPNSSVYKNYLVLADSNLKARYEDLKALVNSEEFISRKAYLEDDKKWEKTDEFQKEKLYQEMKARPHLVNYFKYKDSNRFDFFKQWELVFEDKFDGKSIDTAKWSFVSPLAAGTVGKNFSKFGDLQGFSSKGENVNVDGGSLHIEARKEKIKSLVWSPVGFSEEEMDYSSGMLTTAGLFQSRYGILEAKIKYEPQKELVDVLYLLGKDQSKRLNLVEIGKVNRMGMSVSNNGDWKFNGIDINGLAAGKFYIFRLEWESGKLSWKVNGKELFSTSANVPSEEMDLNLSLLVLQDTVKLPHRFTVDWVRFFQKK